MKWVMYRPKLQIIALKATILSRRLVIITLHLLVNQIIHTEPTRTDNKHTKEDNEINQ
jgi:hypothetical protein